jgi:hypothetical protein
MLKEQGKPQPQPQGKGSVRVQVQVQVLGLARVRAQQKKPPYRLGKWRWLRTAECTFRPWNTSF